MTAGGRILVFAGGVALLWPAMAWACSIPVFRYALERWPADPYELLIFHKGPLTGTDAAVADALRQTAESPLAFANFTVTLVDVGGKMDEPHEMVWKEQKGAELPWLAVRYPDAPPQAPSAWAGPLTAEEVRSLIDSPARRQIAERLLRGDSIVWLVLEGGDKGRDGAAATLLAGELKRLEKTLELPKVDPDDPDVQGPALRSSLPLKLAFSQVRISRGDPAERAFVRMLLSPEPTPPAAGEPVLVPVFGRGRALCIFAGKDITAENIEDSTRFLTGECSCQVKAANPGIDLLLAADWESLLTDEPVKAPQLAEIPIAPKLAAANPAAQQATPARSSIVDRLSDQLTALAVIAGCFLFLLAVGGIMLRRFRAHP